MTATVYSQNSEQAAILAACTAAVGRFCDIGAWNARDKSNTRALYELGWSGVLIEPSPEPFAGLKAEYEGDERIKLMNVAVGLETGTMEMHITADACSTSDAATFEKWKPYVNYTDTIQVPCIALDELMLAYGPFDLISIDTEGTSVELLHRLLELGWRPRCIVVEHDGRTTEALSHATECGYVCTMANGENLVLVKR